MAITSVLATKPVEQRCGRFSDLPDDEKVAELMMLMYQIEAVAGGLEEYANGGTPVDKTAFGLQQALMTLADRGLEITGSR